MKNSNLLDMLLFNPLFLIGIRTIDIVIYLRILSLHDMLFTIKSRINNRVIYLEYRQYLLLKKFPVPLQELGLKMLHQNPQI